MVIKRSYYTTFCSRELSGPSQLQPIVLHVSFRAWAYPGEPRTWDYPGSSPFAEWDQIRVTKYENQALDLTVERAAHEDWFQDLDRIATGLMEQDWNAIEEEVFQQVDSELEASRPD